MYDDIDFVEKSLGALHDKQTLDGPNPLYDDEMVKSFQHARMRTLIMKEVFADCTRTSAFEFGNYTANRANDTAVISAKRVGETTEALGITDQAKKNLGEEMSLYMLPKEERQHALVGGFPKDSPLGRMVAQADATTKSVVSTLDKEIKKMVQKAFIDVILSEANTAAVEQSNFSIGQQNFINDADAETRISDLVIPERAELYKKSPEELSQYIKMDPVEATKSIEKAVTAHILNTLDKELEIEAAKTKKTTSRTSGLFSAFRQSGGASAGVVDKQKHDYITAVRDEVAITQRNYLKGERPQVDRTAKAAPASHNPF